MLLWLCYGPAATAPLGPLAWEPPYAPGEALERQKKKKEKEEEESWTWPCAKCPVFPRTS